MAPITNGRILFNSIPTGYPKPGETLIYDTSQKFDPDTVQLNGGYLLKTLVLSIDPYLRWQMRSPEVEYFAPAYAVGEPSYSYGVGVVVRSENPDVKIGEHLYGWITHEEYSFHMDLGESVFQLIRLDNKHNLPWSVYLGAAGMPGETAYMGWKEYSRAKKGDTVFISSGASSVGSLVIQFAKLDGLKVIASAGSKEKLEFMKGLGADVVFNYKEENVRDVLKHEGPIDVYWDNVGGETLDAALEAAAIGARFIECGHISSYNTGGAISLKNITNVVTRGISMNGFIVFWLHPKYADEFRRVVPDEIATGKLKFTEELTEGLDKLPDVVCDVQMGRNKAKSVVVVAKE